MKKTPKYESNLCSMDCGFLSAEWCTCGFFETKKGFDVELTIDQESGYMFNRCEECVDDQKKHVPKQTEDKKEREFYFTRKGAFPSPD